MVFMAIRMQPDMLDLPNPNRPGFGGKARRDYTSFHWLAVPYKSITILYPVYSQTQGDTAMNRNLIAASLITLLFVQDLEAVREDTLDAVVALEAVIIDGQHLTLHSVKQECKTGMQGRVLRVHW